MSPRESDGSLQEQPEAARFGEAISLLGRAAHAYLSRVLAPYGLGPGVQAYLLTLRVGEEASQDEIARRHRVDKANAARAVATLEELGYVRRRQDAGDRRVRRVTLTKRGAEVQRELEEILSGWIDSLKDAVSDSAWTATVESLVAIADRAMELAFRSE